MPVVLGPRDIITILDLTRGEIEALFEEARRMEGIRRSEELRGRIIAMAFFEPSTRTRLSFEAAAKRLGAEVIGFTSEEGTSIEKGESLADTVRMLDAYADAIVIRHRYEGAARYAAEIARSPVINAGDGAGHHPTQTLLDLYAMWRFLGRIDGLSIAVLGDLRYARVVRSLLLGLSMFDVRLHLVSPPMLAPRTEVLRELEARGVRYSVHSDIGEVIGDIDVLYVVRIQRERIPDPLEYERIRGSYRVTPDLIRRAKPNMVILHPLPRVDEVDPAIDSTPHAKYFEQAALGVPVRMALLKAVLQGYE